MSERALPRSVRRRTLSAALCLGALPLGGCSGARWVEQKKVGQVSWPRRIPIMVFKSAHIRDIDEDGLSDVVATTLSAELERRGIQADVMELTGEPRLPRIELAFWSIDFGTAGAMAESSALEQGSISVDCAFVSAEDEVVFIGRLVGRGKDGNLSAGAEAAGKAIYEALTEG